jgi:hypothetical protein
MEMGSGIVALGAAAGGLWGDASEREVLAGPAWADVAIAKVRVAADTKLFMNLVGWRSSSFGK